MIPKNDAVTNQVPKIPSERKWALAINFCFYFLFHYLWFAPTHPLPGAIPLLFVGLISWLSLKVDAYWTVLTIMGILTVRFGLYQSELTFRGSLTFTVVGAILFLWRSRMGAVVDRLERAIALIVQYDQAGYASFLFDCFFGMLYQLIKVVSLVIVSVVLLANSPFGGGYDRWMKWTLDQKQVLWPGASLIVLLIGIAIVLAEWSRRQISSDQARLWLRSDRIRLQYQDLVRVIRVKQNLDRRKK